MHFYRKCWFDPFEEQFISPFLSDCPSPMLGIAIHCIQHSQAMLECGVCELAHSFFHFVSCINIALPNLLLILNFAVNFILFLEGPSITTLWDCGRITSRYHQTHNVHTKNESQDQRHWSTHWWRGEGFMLHFQQCAMTYVFE